MNKLRILYFFINLATVSAVRLNSSFDDTDVNLNDGQHEISGPVKLKSLRLSPGAIITFLDDTSSIFIENGIVKIEGNENNLIKFNKNNNNSSIVKISESGSSKLHNFKINFVYHYYF